MSSKPKAIKSNRSHGKPTTAIKRLPGVHFMFKGVPKYFRGDLNTGEMANLIDERLLLTKRVWSVHDQNAIGNILWCRSVNINTSSPECSKLQDFFSRLYKECERASYMASLLDPYYVTFHKLPYQPNNGAAQSTELLHYPTWIPAPAVNAGLPTLSNNVPLEWYDPATHGGLLEAANKDLVQAAGVAPNPQLQDADREARRRLTQLKGALTRQRTLMGRIGANPPQVEVDALTAAQQAVTAQQAVVDAAAAALNAPAAPGAAPSHIGTALARIRILGDPYHLEFLTETDKNKAVAYIKGNLSSKFHHNTAGLHYTELFAPVPIVEYREP